MRRTIILREFLTTILIKIIILSSIGPPLTNIFVFERTHGERWKLDGKISFVLIISE